MAAAGEALVLAALLSQLEEIWQHFDELFATLRPEGWRHRHGRDWRFADVPYHLAYFDREVVAAGIESGPRAPAAQRTLMRTHGEFVAWNRAHFAARSAGQTVAESIGQMRAAREAIRRAVAGLSDSDPSQPVWISLTTYGGWRTVRFALELCRMHSWVHFAQLRLYLHRGGPLESPAVTHGALDGFVRSLPALLDRAQAARRRLTFVMNFSGPGGGDWTVRVADGACQVTEGRPARAPLIIAQSPETFVRIVSAMRHPLVALASGQLTVHGVRKLPLFMKLFPKPTLDRVLEPVP